MRWLKKNPFPPTSARGTVVAMQVDDINKFGLWDYHVSRRISLPHKVVIAVLAIGCIYLIVIVLVVLGSNEFEYVPQGLSNNFNYTVHYWFETLEPGLKQKNWNCSSVFITPGDRKQSSCLQTY
jgi:hypothetical protein